MEFVQYMAAKSGSKNSSEWLPFYVHSHDTANIMKKLINNWLPNSTRHMIINSTEFKNMADADEEINKLCVLVALLHDIGKVTPLFQYKISLAIDNLRDLLARHGITLSGIYEEKQSHHDIAGQSILINSGFSEEFAVIIGSHHGRPYCNNARKQFKSYGCNYFDKNKETWQEIREKWIEHSLECAGFSGIDDIPLPDVKAQMIISGLLIMSDWIASNTTYFPLIDTTALLTKSELKKRADNAWNKLNLPDVWNPHLLCDDEDFRKRFGFPPNEFQCAAMNISLENSSHGIYILEAPMGLGKTETALAVAEIIAQRKSSGGIYFGLPTQATANGIFERIHKWSKSFDEYHSIRLAHGMTDLNEKYQSIFHGTAVNSIDENKISEKNDYECVIVHDWFEGRKQALLSDFVVATVDQFLLASLKQKHVMLRHLGLAGKVVIIDECHAYDAYMNVYLDATLKWMGAYKVPVIVLSATLPPERRRKLISAYLNNSETPVCDSMAYPVITWTDGDEVHQQAVGIKKASTHIAVNRISEDDIVQNLRKKLADGGCAGVIVNTVRYAQKLATLIENSIPDSEVICFHSRFIHTDRADKEKTILSRTGDKSKPPDRNRLIVVGTQVLEQSLDIDFDYMITEICPMDLLLQRSGRLHRHNRQRPQGLESAELSILDPTDENARKNTLFIYTEWLISRTEKYLPESFTIPECIPELVSIVYSEPENAEEQASDEWKDYINRIRKKIQKASSFCIDSESIEDSYDISELIDNNVGSGVEAEASVRDTEETLEVIAMKKVSDTEYGFITNDAAVNINNVPSEDEAKLIAKQRLRLPLQFSYIRSNQELKHGMPKLWNESGWLKGEYLLVFDENLSAVLNGKTLVYDSKTGLTIKEGE